MVNLLKYGLSGALASAVDFGLFAFLVRIAQWPWFWASFVSFNLATLTGYLLSIRLVFISGARFRKHEEIVLVFAISLIGLLINQLVLFFLISLKADALLAKAITSIVVVSWNYLARTRFVFRFRVS